MNTWRGTWAMAQFSGVVVSSMVWIVVWGLSVPALALILAVSVAAVVGRNTRPMLWWLYGSVPANGFQRDAILATIVPIAWLRGRRQPAVWIGRRIAGSHVLMTSPAGLVVSPGFLHQVVNAQLTDRQASAITSHALGRVQVFDSNLVNAMDAYCLPWRLVQIFTSVAGQLATPNPILWFSWKMRWIVLGVAAVDAYRNARWAALIGLIVLSVLSWSTGHFKNRWVRKLQDLGDQRVISEGLGPDLADLIRRSDRSIAANERADGLCRGTPSQTMEFDGPVGQSQDAPKTTSASDRPERRGCWEADLDG